MSSLFLAASALFTASTPLLLIMIILVVGGFFRSLQFTAINTVAYAEVEPAQMSRATTLVSVNQQLAISAGVAVGEEPRRARRSRSRRAPSSPTADAVIPVERSSCGLEIEIAAAVATQDNIRAVVVTCGRATRPAAGHVLTAARRRDCRLRDRDDHS